MYRTKFNPLRKSILEQPWLQEVLVFSTVLILFSLNEWRDITKWDDVIRSICFFLVLYLHAQIHRFLVLPLLLERRKPLPYALSGITLLVAFSTLLYFCTALIYPDCTQLNPAAGLTFFYWIGTVAMSLIAILAPFIVLRFYNQQKQQATSQLCVQEMELNLLRSQLNPHFLFNTFNNLYGISLQEPERLPDLILQTSKLMRYQLEDKLWAPLQDELMFTESYLALEEERVCNRCEVHYKYQKTSEESKYVIAPMMLIPFIENAFKHGTDCMSKGFVHLCIRLESGWLSMQLRNSIPPNNMVRKVPSTGIGLENVQQRLNILYPGNKHRLWVEKTATEYSVTLELKLTPAEEHESKIHLPDRR